MAGSQPTKPRTYRRVCQKCRQTYIALSNRRKACPACCKCLECRAQLPDGSHRFCGLSCAGKWRAAQYPDNKGRFQKGVSRTYTRTCDTCGRRFAARTGSRKRCPDCCKCKECGKQMPNATHDFCGNSCAGRWKYRNSEAVREAMEKGQTIPKKSWGALKGRSAPWHRGEKNPNWKGGRGIERHAAMGRVEYKIWRATVFKRDGYRCVVCEASGCPLQANHIKRWKDHPELRYDPDNGVTMCVECHGGIYGIEEEFAERFTAYVASCEPLELTDEEKERFEPFVTACNHCGAELKRSRYLRKQKFHFCNKACQTEYIREFGMGNAKRKATSSSQPSSCRQRTFW